MSTLNHLKCGYPLKTRPCGRSAWWPGGRCPRHGYGAKTLEEFMIGLSEREAGPQDVRWQLLCRTTTEYKNNKPKESIDIVWRICGWSGSSFKTWVSGEISKEDLIVLGDKMLEKGIITQDDLFDRIHGVIENYNTLLRKISGEEESNRALAKELRSFGFSASICGDGILLSVVSAEKLLKILE